MAKPDRMRGALMLCELHRDLPTFAVEHLTAAFAGDPEEAAWLLLAAPNPMRGRIALAMYHMGVRRAAYRAALLSAWGHDHDQVRSAARSRVMLAAMFRRAAFPIPEAVPEAFEVWRGTHGLSKAVAAQGASWTTERDVACWFAVRGGPDRVPLVLKRRVRRADVLLWHEGRDENEVVILANPRAHGAMIDGDPEDWQSGFDRVSARIRESRQSALQAAA